MLHQQQVGQLFADTWLIPNLVVNFIKIEKKHCVCLKLKVTRKGFFYYIFRCKQYNRTTSKHKPSV